MTGRLTKNAAPLAGTAMFLLALWALHHELREYNYHDIRAAIERISGTGMALALGLAAAGYAALTCYDVLAFRYVHKQLPWPKIAMTSFIGYAFSNNIGFAWLSGGSVRYRLYSNWALTPGEIGRIVAFCTVTGWLGFFGAGGVALVFEPTTVFAALHMPFESARVLGILFAGGVLAYVAASVLWRKSLTFHAFTFELPPPSLAMAQVLVAFTDLSLSGSVLYVLLPPETSLSYPAFLGIYLLGILAGLISHVPGGVGVFETILLLALSSKVPTASLVGSLLAYRVAYYLIPLGMGLLAFSAYELRRRRTHVARVAKAVSAVMPDIVPHLFAFMTFVGGVALLISGATPSVHGRMAWLRDFLPLPVVETSHLMGSLVGVGLILLARGIERRLDAAYVLSSILLAAGAAVSLLKGFDYEEALILTAMFALLLPCRSYFYRKASLFHEPFSFGWIASIAIVLICVSWIGWFSFKHLDYSHDLWWHFSMRGDAPRFLRAELGVVVVVLSVMIGRFLHPAPTPPALPSPDELERARAITSANRNVTGYLALLGDKALLFNDTGNAFIMYGAEGKSWVALGDPIGPADDMADLLWQFRELAERCGRWAVFYQVQADCLPLYLDLGLQLTKLGEEARVPMASFSLEGGTHKTQRNLLAKLEREGCVFEIVPAEAVPALLPELRNVSDEWMRGKNTREKGFSLGRFDARYLSQFPQAIVRREGRIVAFTNLWASGCKQEFSVDLMRFTADAPNSTMEYLFLQLMQWGKAEGYEWFNLGMAPLAGLENRALAPLWNRAGALVFRFGEHFYNFQGLRQYKEKFNPVWRPKYLAYPGGLALPVILANIASLVSGGLKGVVTK